MHQFSQGAIWAAIDALAQRRGLTPSGLARMSGLDPTAFNRSKRQSSDGRPRWLSTESLAKVLESTGTSIEDFISLMQGEGAPLKEQLMRKLPLLGFAKAGTDGYFDNSGFPSGQGWGEIDAPANAGPRAYALTVVGESMLPLYRDGDVLVIDPEVRYMVGDRVVARTCEGEVMAKLLKRHDQECITLASFNPEHPDLPYDPDEIEWIARIIWASQ